MQEHTEQHLDKLAKKVVKSSTLESPSLDFTANVMAEIEASSISEITVYKPLISKRSWFILMIIIGGGLIYSFTGSNIESTGLLEKMDFSIISDNMVTEALAGFTISKIFAYAIGFFGLVFFVQIPMMKHYLDKRFDEVG